jgi:RHS repeat-associated protein
VGGNPLVSSVSDPSGTITSTVDLLGRVTSYTDTWGQTTTTAYNQAGQATATSGPGGSYQLGYDPNSGQPTTTTVNGTLLATASYDSVGRMTGVAYNGNGTSAAIGYDAYGKQDGLTYNAPGGSVLDQDTVTRTLAGRESTETASQAGGLLSVSYTYDGAGRLTQAADTSGGTQVSSYSYAARPSCPSQNAGENTNRTSVTIGTTTTSYCYNNADQLVSSTVDGTTSTSYAYNERGDQTSDNGTTYTWDSSDRAASAATGGTSTTSTYDAVDRLVESDKYTSSGNLVTHTIFRYFYAGYSDSPAAVLDVLNNVQQQIVALPGGVTVTLQPSGNVWSYTNLQGDTTATANNSGALTAGPVTYDPWGTLNPGQTAPRNTTGPNTLGAYATAGKLTNEVTGTILLGARTLNPAEARFLSVDPVQGGCANPYVYASGDPLTQQDLTGLDYCFSIPASMALDIANGVVDATEAIEVSNLADVPGDILSIVLDVGSEHLTWAAETATDWARGQRIQAHTPGGYAGGNKVIGNAAPMVAIDIPAWHGIPDGIPRFIPWVKDGYGTKGVNPCASS